MATSPRSPKSSRSGGCSSVAIFGIILVVIQLALFKVGLKYFHAHNDVGSAGGGSSGMILGPTSRSSAANNNPGKVLNDFQQTSRKRRRDEQKHNQQQQRQKKTDYFKQMKDADGLFNGYPIKLKTEKGVHTLPHCVGENYQEGIAWQHRSCRFGNYFCFDTTTQDYVVFQSPEEERLYTHLEARPFVDVSQSYMKRSHDHSNTVSLGGINLKWTDKPEGIPRLEWFPEIRTLPPDKELTYYELPKDVVMIPFHSLNGKNPGHLVWDDFLPIYTLLTMFQLEEKSNLLMMRYVLKDRGLWASCDFTDENREACKHMHRKFLPLMMGLKPIHDMTTNKDFDFQIFGKKGGEADKKAPGAKPKSSLICANEGLAGMGALTDHGTSKMHGWEEDDYKITHNHGRGGQLYAFRNYMVSNLGLPIEYEQTAPFRIVFSEKSSDMPSRYIDFSTHIDILRRTFNPALVSVESYVMKDLSLSEQVEIAGQTSIFITGCGGGAVSAMFLPKGSSVFLYYLEDGGLKYGRQNNKPARLDWDLFNNLGYLKVHWLPKTTMLTEVDLRALVILVQHELDGLLREKSYDRFFSTIDKE